MIDKTSPYTNRVLAVACISAAPFLASAPAVGGSFFAPGGGVTYPIGYTGNGTDSLDVKVCLVPSMSAADASAVERPLRNAMARWNKGQPTTANVRDNFLPSGVDFESVALHELGHCVGLAHPNIGGVIGSSTENDPRVNATQSNPGADGVFGLDAGADGVFGSADDRRGDDTNNYLFRSGVNDPFSMPEVVDASTYTTDLGALPAGDLFPANAEAEVGAAAGIRFTEAAMQHDLLFRQLARTPSHDDISAIRFAESGFDGRQGTADDYDLKLVWGGVSSASDCDITVAFAPDIGLARCSARFFSNGQSGSSTLLSGEIEFGPRDTFEWFFNQDAPCNASDTLVANQWRQVSLPCEVGVSGPATVRAVFGDDLGAGAYDDTWVLFVYEYGEAVGGTSGGRYRKLALDDDLASGVGYWMVSRSDAVIDVTGEYHAQMDTAVFPDAARDAGWNMVGNPFRYQTAWGDARIVDVDGTLIGLSAADPGSNTEGNTACTRESGPSRDCVVSRFAYRYDAGIRDYDELTPSSGALRPFDAVWVEALRPDVEIRIAMPSAERTSQ